MNDNAPTVRGAPSATLQMPHPVLHSSPAHGPRHASTIRWLVALWILSTIIRFGVSLTLHHPSIYLDELEYWSSAQSFHDSGKFLLFGEPLDMPAVLYSISISPAFAFVRASTTHVLAKLISSLLMCSVVFPAYGLAREFLGRKDSVFVAILSLLLCGGVYSATVMSENLFYPFFLASLWLSFRVLADGRLMDGVAAGSFWILSFFTKPHITVLMMAYIACLGLWLLSSLTLPLQGQIRAVFIRSIPLLLFSIIALIRIFVRTDLSLYTRVLGTLYGQMANSHTSLDWRWVTTSAIGLGLTTVFATGFVVLPVCLYSFITWRSTPVRERWFWVFTSLCYLAFVAIVSRHNATNDSMIRIHERYIFIVFPALFVWFFSCYRRVSTQALTVLAALIVGVSTFGFAVGITIWLNHPTWSDSPSTTLFYSLYARLSSPALCMAVLTIFGLSSLVAIMFSKKSARALVIVISMQLVLLNAGWYEFQLHYIQPIEKHSRIASRLIQNTITPGDPVAFLSDNLDPQIVWSFGYWARNPVRVYGLSTPTPWSSEAGMAKFDEQRRLSFGAFVPGYVVANIELPLPLLRDDPQNHVKIYKYPSLLQPAN